MGEGSTKMPLQYSGQGTLRKLYTFAYANRSAHMPARAHAPALAQAQAARTHEHVGGGVATKSVESRRMQTAKIAVPTFLPVIAGIPTAAPPLYLSRSGSASA